MSAVLSVGRIGKRERAAALQERMLRYSRVYNATCLLRHAWLGSETRRQECVNALAAVIARELQRAEDVEALIYAIGDALYASPLGVPWEA